MKRKALNSLLQYFEAKTKPPLQLNFPKTIIPSPQKTLDPSEKTVQVSNPPKPLKTPKTLFPTLTLSLSPNHANFIKFLKTHLKPPLNPQNLLKFLTTKLTHNPNFRHYDFHLFKWAPLADDTFRHDHATVEWMARSLAATDRFPDLAELLSRFAAVPCPCADQGIFACPKTEAIFGVAINAYCRVGNLDNAISAFNTMVRLIDGKPSVSLCNALITGFMKWNRFEEGLRFYERVVDRERVKPDVITFNILLGGYCRNRDTESALGLFKEMRERDCVPNVVSFNTLIKGFFRERQVERAVEIAREMVYLGLGFSTATCEILVDGLCRDNKVFEACEALVDFAKKNVVPKGYDYLNLVEVLCRNGHSEKCLEVVREMWDLGNAPSLVTCTTLIEGLRKLKRFDDALELAKRMISIEGLVPDIVTFNCLVGDLCGAGRAFEADKLRVLGLSKGFLPDSTTYHILVSGYTKLGKRREVEMLVDTMLDMGFIDGIASYNQLMDKLDNSITRLKTNHG